MEPAGGNERPQQVAVGDAGGLSADDPDLRPGRIRRGFQETPPGVVEIGGPRGVQLVPVFAVDRLQPPGEAEQPLGSLIRQLVLTESARRPFEEGVECRAVRVHGPVARLLVEQTEQRPGESERIAAGRPFDPGGGEERVLHHQRARQRGDEPRGRIAPLQQLGDRAPGSQDRGQPGRLEESAQQAPPERALQRDAGAVTGNDQQERLRFVAGFLAETAAQRPPVGKAPDAEADCVRVFRCDGIARRRWTHETPDHTGPTRQVSPPVARSWFPAL